LVRGYCGAVTREGWRWIVDAHKDANATSLAQNRRIADPRRIAQFLCPNLSEKFALLFRCFRLGEFLEARIVPKRIEHWIEPEQRGSERDAHRTETSVWYREHFLNYRLLPIFLIPLSWRA
jgi:hypothetical protein